jgi:hypothetical protein
MKSPLLFQNQPACQTFYTAARRIRKNFRDKSEGKRAAEQIPRGLTRDAQAVDALTPPKRTPVYRPKEDDSWFAMMQSSRNEKGGVIIPAP